MVQAKFSKAGLNQGSRFLRLTSVSPIGGRGDIDSGRNSQPIDRVPPRSTAFGGAPLGVAVAFCRSAPVKTMNAHGRPSFDQSPQSDWEGSVLQSAACEGQRRALGASGRGLCFSWCPVAGCAALCGACPPAAPGEDGQAPQSHQLHAPAPGTRDSRINAD